MSTSGGRGIPSNSPQTNNRNALPNAQKPGNQRRTNDTSQRAEAGGAAAQTDSSPISSDVSVAEIKNKAKEAASQLARGVSATDLIKKASTQVLLAKEQEAKGDLRVAFAFYIKAATLAKLTMDSPEYMQEAKGAGGVIRKELNDFLENDGRNITKLAMAVEEKLRAAQSGHAVVSPLVVISPSSSASKGAPQNNQASVAPAATKENGASQASASASSASTNDSDTQVKPTLSQRNTGQAQKQSAGASPNSPAGGSAQANNVYSIENFPVKSLMCKHWQKDSKCPFGQRCRFSHAIQIKNAENVASASLSVPVPVSEGSQKPPANRKGKRARANERQKEVMNQKRAEEERLAREKLEKENEEKRRRAEEEKREKREEAERVERERREKVEREERERKEQAEREERERREQAKREKQRREEQQRREAEERQRREAEERQRREAEERQRKAAEERQRKEEAAQRKKEVKKAKQEAAARIRAHDLEQARLRNEERLARERAAREAAQREHQEQLKVRREKEAAAIEQYIVSESSLVTCAAGLNIQGVVSGFELCRITIKNLPSDAKQDEIADIFMQQGVASSEFFVLHLKPTGNKREAVVLANVDQGQNIAVGLEGIEFRNEYLTFEVSENASWSGMSTAAQNAFLTVSWWAPSEMIIVTYDSLDQAREQTQRLNGKTWNGRRIRAMLDDRATVFSSQVKILGCAPGTALSTEFYIFVETFNVRTLRNSAHWDMDEVFRDVRDHLRTFPGVQMQSYEVLNNGNQLDAEARIKIGFDDWEEAKRAHDSMDKKRLRPSNFPVLRSWLPKPLQYSIKIPRQQHQAQKAQWDELSERKPGRNAHVHTRIGDRGDVFIRVLGEDKKAAGSLKVRVEGMVAGEKLDNAHWHPSFASPRGKIFLDRVLNEKVYVRSDFKTRCLRACGESARVEEAKRMIREEVERLAGMETTRILDGVCVRGFMREGLGKLKELIGEDNVVVNVASVPYKVTVKGGAEATHHLQRLMDESRAMGALYEAQPGDAERETCPICTDDISNPEQLGCGHTYCSGCLSHFLTSAVDSKNFPLVCMGNGGACRVPIAIPFIRQFLPQQLFENLVEAAFVAYLEQHPQELKYCTTPDCKQIYRRRLDKALLKCPACFSTICPQCDEEAHEGMTCQERRIHRDPELQDRLNEELAREQGFKKCPSCSVFIEKIMGCNHMTCRCGAHICWKCMGIFTADTIYPHLNSAHNGIHDEIPGHANQRNAAADEDMLMAAQIQELQRFEREQQARAARRAQGAVHDPLGINHDFFAFRPAPALNGLPGGQQGAAAGVRQEPAWIQELAARQEAERVRLRTTQERARREREQEVWTARYQAQRRAEAEQREVEQRAALQRAEEQRRRQEEGSWCVVM